MGKMYDILRYHVVPPLFIPFFTCGCLLLVLYASGQPLTLKVTMSRCLGNAFSWKVVGIMLLWAWASLRVPGPLTYGPLSPHNVVPVYKNNGFQYYVTTVLAFIILMVVHPQLSDSLAEAHAEIIATLNIAALTLCVYLLIIGKGRTKYTSKEPRRPLMFEFYRGMEYHPRILGVDVKQFTNCRVGLMGWQLLEIAFYISAARRHGDHISLLVPCLLQSLYIAKFFWWEDGYFNTLDITLDRAGYYLCWGCMVLIPSLFTLSSFYAISYPPKSWYFLSLVALLLGVMATALQYRVDYEKYTFRSTSKHASKLWGRPVKYIEAEYINEQGVKQTSRLLLSGMWGIARHMNYTFEIIAAISWCLPFWGLGIIPFLYPIFIIVLLFHRIYRDEDKCRNKYGKAWIEYCKHVPFRLVPQVF